MLFNSFEFFLFLAIVFALYWFAFNKKVKWQNVLVLAASYVFYGWWDWRFISLLILSTLLDFAYGYGVAVSNRKKAKCYLWLSILTNLGLLATFKYYNFFVVQFEQGLESLGITMNPVLLQIALPVGISFYTFHGMSYVFEIYRGKLKPVSSFVDYAVFVSFFPLLVAGPIERADHLLPQIQNRRSFSYTQAAEGCRLILWGLCKKVILADSLAGITNEVFSNYTSYDGLSLLAAAIAFSFQIYGDFSGYSDIAIGTAKLFGFELLSNFRFPYFSRDIAEFWRRWHISLSSWFRDYLYIPLGGSKQGKFKAVRNTFIVFLLSGFWHGASWNFLAWGFLHACAFLPLLLTNRNRKYSSDVVASDRLLPNVKEFLQMITTFGIVTFAWIFFRTDGIINSFQFIGHAFTNIFQSSGDVLKNIGFQLPFIYIGIFILLDWTLRRDERRIVFTENKILRRSAYAVSSMVLLFHMDLFSNNGKFEFIYFQF